MTNPNPCYFVVLRHCTITGYWDFLAGPYESYAAAEMHVDQCREWAEALNLCYELVRYVNPYRRQSKRQCCEVRVEERGGDHLFGCPPYDGKFNRALTEMLGEDAVRSPI